MCRGSSEAYQLQNQTHVPKKQGFYCIDADKIVHDLYKSGGVGANKIAIYFGKQFLDSDGSVDRKKIRDEVFHNDDERKYLENLIHQVKSKVLDKTGINLELELQIIGKEL